MGTYRGQRWRRKAHIGGILPPTYAKNQQVHTCIHSHMRPPTKNHNLVPPWPFYKTFFLFESPPCVQYKHVIVFD